MIRVRKSKLRSLKFTILVLLSSAILVFSHRAIAQPAPTFEASVLSEINQVRANPKAYAEWLNTQKRNYQNNILRLPGNERVLTHEGLSAMNDAIAFLRTAPTLPPLSSSPELSNSARNFGKIDKKYDRISGSVAELRSRTQKTSKATVLLMVLNDGDRNRSVRTSLFQPNYQSAGIACRIPLNLSQFCILALSSPPQQESRPTQSARQPERPVQRAAEKPESIAEIEQAIVDETNRLRANPQAYAAELAELKQYFQGNLLKLPGHPALETQEGVAVVNEAIRDLKATAPISALTVSQGLSLGARDHVLDIGPKGKAGHYGTDGSDPFVRINRYGTWQGSAGENISFSPIATAKWHVRQWMIDDGVKSREHRKALLNPGYRLTGTACGAHAVYGQMCVMTYSKQYIEGNIQGRR
ncbi:MAG: hypothetical protein KME10_07530 [Plectolyngbya sp. WJT66-NPBG17]|jgi:uncharacterized protein YkwD|nr:hypothetical protein [Plectolyngbya sp. WJT66-NPBG17]MBW4525347.1 hypothetical protein [Phormidium tanganyikae FI6-MK23]